jgi:predicted DNA-binding antitoxin AbrB/MazE fold protein
VKNETIYYTLKELGVRDSDMAEYLSKRTGKTKHLWKVKISDGTAVTLYKSNAKVVKEFNKYAKELLDARIKHIERVLKEWRLSDDKRGA